MLAIAMLFVGFLLGMLAGIFMMEQSTPNTGSEQ